MFERQIQETDAFQKMANELSYNLPTERLTQLGSELLSYLFHTDSYWRSQAARQLGRLHERAFWSHPALLAQLSKEQVEAVTLSLIHALGALQTPNEEITEQLLNLFQKTPLVIVRKAIIEALGTSGTSIVLPTLKQALQDEYLASAAVFSLYCQGADGAQLIGENKQGADWWEWALRTGQEQAASLEKLPAESIDKIAIEAPLYLQRRLAQHQNLSAETALQFSTSPDPLLRKRLAANPYTPLYILQSLSQDSHESVRCGLSKNPKIPTNMIELLLKDESFFVSAQLASNPALEERLLSRFATSPSVYARYQASCNPKLPEGLLLMLSKDTSPEVRTSIASSYATPQEALAVLAHDISPEVRRGATLNPKLPLSTIEQLAITDEETKTFLAESESLPISIRLQLSQDTSWVVRAAIASSSKTPGWLLRILATDSDSEVRRNVARHTSAPEDILIWLSRSEDDNVRDSIARNSATPEPILQKLSNDPFEVVRGSLGHNPSLPPYLLEKLLTSGTRADSLASNPNFPLARLLELGKFRKFESQKLPSYLFPATIDNLTTQARWALSTNPMTPEILLEQISRAAETALGMALQMNVARNESTPEYVLLWMVNERDVVLEALIQQESLAPGTREALLEKITEEKRQACLCMIE